MKWSLLLIPTLLISCQAPRPKELGLIDHQGKKVLRTCPEKPNCVITHYEGDSSHYMKAINYQIPQEDARQRLLGILKKSEGAVIITEEPNYIHAEYTSSLFKFVDDVEFNFSDPSFIHFRSASRTGHSDLGVNRKRMNDIIFRFYQNDR